MGVVPVRDKSYRVHNINRFTGGMTFTQQGDDESEKFENFEMLRDGYLTSRLGCYKANSNSIGSAAIVGIGKVTAGGNTFTFAAKTGTTWYYSTSNSWPVAFSSITVPESPLTDAVRMESVLDSSNASYAVFTNVNFTRLISWDGGAASASQIAGSPANMTFVRHFDGRLYAANKAQTIYFSDKSNPFSWPTANVFYVSSVYGGIRGLERYPGMLLILMERAILGLRGDPATGFNVTVLHDRIGCDTEASVSTSGSATAFRFERETYLFNGNVTSLTANLTGLQIADAGASSANSWGVLTPYHYVMRRSRGTGAVATEAYVLNRQLGNLWGLWNYPTATLLGASSPLQAIVAAPNLTDGFLMNGGDGSLYFQPIRQAGDFNYTNSIVAFTEDDTTRPVLSLWRSKKFYLGSSTLVKQWRRVLVGGSGTAVSLTARYRNPAGTLVTEVLKSSATVPFNVDTPTIDGVTGQSLFSSLQIELSGNSLQIPDVQVHWRPVRFSAGGDLS